MPPLFSTITLGTELLVTAAVLTVLYRGYYRGVFSSVLASIALAYEIIFNITYMANRATHSDPVNIAVAEPLYIGLAIFHGIFSIVMFASLIIFFSLAWRSYRQGTNYFRERPHLTVVFTVCWLIAIISGMCFYFVSYFA